VPHGPKASPDASSSKADGIVIATGASARTLPVPAGLASAHTLRTLDDAQDLARQLPPGTRLVIVGAGFIGAEVASTARALGAEVTVVCSDTVPLSRPFGREMAADISALHEINGVELICDAAIEPYYSGEGVVSGLRLADGRYLPADVVLAAVGAITTQSGLPAPALDCAMASSVIRWAAPMHPAWWLSATVLPGWTKSLESTGASSTGPERCHGRHRGEAG
jgi:NADPH-dependent 2,4-dienoyl-CoA reductase/sulfur reductase-like enzyme